MALRPPGLGHPLVLAHGGGRFDILIPAVRDRLPSPGAVRLFNRLIGDRLSYFRHIRRTLEARGFDVYEPTVSFAANLERRAGDLRRAVEQILAPRGPSAKVSIIAHSMGGLDARYMIARLGIADRVAALVTIGVPHLGSSFADWRLQDTHLGRRLIRWSGRAGLDLRGFEALTRARCRALNAEVEALEAANGVAYFTVASAQEREERVFPPLRRAWRHLREREGRNDGLVSHDSQQWTRVLRGPGAEKRVEQWEFPVPADHLNQCGWWHPWTGPWRERRAFERTIRNLYLRIAETLRARHAE
jgi:triacylglycerol lipase